MSVMQKNEEDLLNKVDEYCNEYFLKRLREPEVASVTNLSDSSNAIARIENLQAYLLQLQESQGVVAQQMTQVAYQFNQIMQSSKVEEEGHDQ